MVVRQKTFKLIRPTLALDVVDGRQRIVTLPADEIVILHEGLPDRSGLVKVCWDARLLAMFAVDLSTRGTEITEAGEDTEIPGPEILPSTLKIAEWTG